MLDVSTLAQETHVIESHVTHVILMWKMTTNDLISF